MVIKIKALFSYGSVKSDLFFICLNDGYWLGKFLLKNFFAFVLLFLAVSCEYFTTFFAWSWPNS